MLFLSAAARALDLLNFTPLNNKPIRIMYSQRDPSIRKSGAANIFIKVVLSFSLSQFIFLSRFFPFVCMFSLLKSDEWSFLFDIIRSF